MGPLEYIGKIIKQENIDTVDENKIPKTFVINVPDPFESYYSRFTDINKPINGQLSTNDKLSPGSTYGMPYADNNNPADGIITINPDGSYTFNATIPGKYVKCWLQNK